MFQKVNITTEKEIFSTLVDIVNENPYAKF